MDDRYDIHWGKYGWSNESTQTASCKSLEFVKRRSTAEMSYRIQNEIANDNKDRKRGFEVAIEQ